MSPNAICFWLMMTFAGSLAVAGVARIINAIRLWRLTVRAAREAAKLDFEEEQGEADSPYFQL
jgi:hypothetical protein